MFSDFKIFDVSSSLKKLRVLIVFLIAAPLFSCVVLPITGEDTDHYLVIGVGLVSVQRPDLTAQQDSVVTRMEAFGFVQAPSPTPRYVLGYLSQSTVEIPVDAQNTIVEVSQEFGGPLKVSTPVVRVPDEF